MVRESSPDDILAAVRNKYSRVATHPKDKFKFPVGRSFAESVGYPTDVLDKLPTSMTESFAGAHNPILFAELQPGESVLDLGCGAGLDMFLAARAVGHDGSVHGLDMSPDMVEKTRFNLAEMGVSNVCLHCTTADSIPLEDNSVDVVISNGIYNLSPRKEPIIREVFRILKPGGRTVLSEIILEGKLPETILDDIEKWFA